MILIQVAAWALATVYLIAGKALSPVMAAIGICTGWRYKLTWPWGNNPNKVGGNGKYYDDWYADPDNHGHTRLSRWAWNQGGFAREFYWRVRNGFSNGARYAFPVTKVEDIQTYNWKYGFYQYDEKNPWMARIRFRFPVSERYVIEVYVGFKIDRSDGSGFTNRLPFRLRRRG